MTALGAVYLVLGAAASFIELGTARGLHGVPHPPGFVRSVLSLAFGALAVLAILVVRKVPRDDERREHES